VSAVFVSGVSVLDVVVADVVASAGFVSEMVSGRDAMLRIPARGHATSR